jgi:hypothetical protein
MGSLVPLGLGVLALVALIAAPIVGVLRYNRELDHQYQVLNSLHGEPAIDGCIPSLASGCLGSTFVVSIALTLGVAAIVFYALELRKFKAWGGARKPSVLGLVFGIVAVLFALVPLLIVTMVKLAMLSDARKVHQVHTQGAPPNR